VDELVELEQLPSETSSTEKVALFPRSLCSTFVNGPRSLRTQSAFFSYFVLQPPCGLPQIVVSPPLISFVNSVSTLEKKIPTEKAAAAVGATQEEHSVQRFQHIWRGLVQIALFPGVTTGCFSQVTAAWQFESSISAHFTFHRVASRLNFLSCHVTPPEK
jgi:hypothetical protein